jgi:metal-responsive CopG/Arc/MetJ family transcriptional regulator
MEADLETVEKVSVSLPQELLRFVERYQKRAKKRSRSEVFEEALRLLRAKALEAEYADAAGEFDAAEWEGAAGDGLDRP